MFWKWGVNRIELTQDCAKWQVLLLTVGTVTMYLGSLAPINFTPSFAEFSQNMYYF
jgi:hypothetical protein